MCGIAGSINYTFSDKEVYAAMKHRGPDEQNNYVSDRVQFYHLRLSILDIACGQQPMDLGEKYTIVFNGEIFNHAELREQFNIEGHTASDTETLLLLYEKLGEGLLDHLDGMFAFAIHDKVKNIIFLARDRAGEKPLYYFADSSTFVFASELNALKQILPLEICHTNFYQFLRFGSFYRTHTPYRDVSELPAGTFLRIDCSTLNLTARKWWDINPFYQNPGNDSIGDCIEKTDLLLHQSIKRRIESSDLEVGSFLSGGIDSGLVTAIAHQYNPGIKTFTVSFEGAYDEAPLAALVAKKYNTRHHEIKISFSNLKNDVEKIIANYGEPFFDSSAVPSYYVSKAAKEYVTVVLNGDGADELFGGYRRYIPFAKFDFFTSPAVFRNLGRTLTSLFPPAHEKQSLYNYLYRMASFASMRGPDVYLSAGVDIFEGFTDKLTCTGTAYLDDYIRDFERICKSTLSGLRKIMNLDFEINLFNDLLVKMDIATMANSQEGRSPFLSKDLLEYIPTIPDEYKVKGKITKVLLRRLAKSYLPPELIYQPKRGFEIPLKKWVNFELNEIISDYLRAVDSFYATFVDRNFVLGLLEHRVRISEEKRAKILWTLFSMEVWYKNVFKYSTKRKDIAMQ